MNIQKLMNKNFTLMVIGQVISLFGNSILRFSLSLYVLKTTGSASIFGTILAISIIPTILLSPLGGIIADRVSRKHIMLTLDFITSALIFIFSFFISQTIPIITIGIVMVVLSIIQAFYQPSVQASIPLLATDEHLMQANGIVVQVSALANLLGPIIAGMLYTILPITLLLDIAAIAFFASAILECIMKISFIKPEKKKNGLSLIVDDLKEGMHYISKNQPILLKILFVIAAINLFIASLITVGLPVMTNIILGLNPQFYGWLEAGIAIGSIIGSLLLPLISKKYNIKNSYLFLIFGSLTLTLLSIAMFVQNQVYFSYALIMIGSVLTIMFATIFNIFAQTFMQQSTPNELLGKVSSFVTVISMCSYPIGQAIYGVLFDSLANSSYLIILGAVFIGLIIFLFMKKYLQQIQ